jgi:hypothetical protein
MFILVLAKFFDEDDVSRQSFSWYRGKIISVDSEKQTYTVFFSDYGNVDDCLKSNDLAYLPEHLNFEKYPQYSYRIQLNKVKLDMDKHIDFLTEYFTGEHYKFKVIDHQLNNEIIYNVELWNSQMNKCLNEKIDPNYSSISSSSKNLFKSLPKANNSIDFSELDKRLGLIDLRKENLFVNTKYLFIDKFHKPFYFCLEENISKRDELKAKLSEFYNEEDRPDLTEFTNNTYCAVYSEQIWYRARIKNQQLNLKNKNNNLILFYIDYGYEEIILPESNMKIKVLDEQFYKYPRYAFGTMLTESVVGENNNLLKNDIKLIDLEETIDELDLDSKFEEFFSSTIDDFRLKIDAKLIGSEYYDDDDIFLKDETYYAIQMFNKDNCCLNDIIIETRKEQVKKKFII